MKRAPISTLKASLSEYIASVKRGEEVVVTERGKPVARIVPILPAAVEDDRIRELVKRGVVRAATRNLRRALPGRAVRTVSEGAASRALEEERRDRC